jgi:hypothetical protein
MDDKFFDKPDKDRIEEEYKRLTRRMERKKKMEAEGGFGTNVESKRNPFDNPYQGEGDKERLDWEYRRLTKRVERKKQE